MNLEQLRKERNDAAAKMKALADLEASGTNLSPEQTTEFDAAAKGFDDLDAQVKRAERAAGVQARLKEPLPSPGARQVASLLPEGPIHPAGPEAKTKFECFEEFLCAVDVAKFDRVVDQRLDYHQLRLGAEQSMGTGSKGGFMVPTEFRPDLLKVDPAQQPISAAALRLPPGSAPDASVSLPALDQDTNQHGGVTVTRIGEGAAKPETDFNLKEASWTPKEIAGHVALTDQLIRNWSGAMGMAQTLLGSALGAALEQEAYSGNGAQQMLGILNSPAAYKVARTTALRFKLADVANMVKRKLQRGGAAFWLINPLLMGDLITLEDANGNAVYVPNIAAGVPPTLFGYPVFFYEFASAVGALGDVALVQPNPYYVIKDGSGPFIDVGFINDDFTKNKRRVKIFLLNDGRPWLQAPFKLVNGTEVSPFVLLDVP